VTLGEAHPKLTGTAGLVLVAELDRVVGLVAGLDAAVDPIKSRRQGHGAGGVVISLAEMMLAGGDFFCDLDTMRSDTAGAKVRTISEPPSSPTAIALGRRFEDVHFAGLERGVATLCQRVTELLPVATRAALTGERPTIDLDATDTEVYGSKKQGVAYSYEGKRCGRSVVAFWAEPGWALAADLVSGVDDPRPLAPSLVARSVAGLPPGLGRPRVRADSGFFAGSLAVASLAAGADYAIAAKRNPAVWRSMRQIPENSWVQATDMHQAQVAVCDYKPGGWPTGTYTIVRRVAVTADEVSHDMRSRRRRTIDPNQLPLLLAGDLDASYAYSFIVTNITNDDHVGIEAWFRKRADIEERFRDAKLGMALRHLPSGHAPVNRLWMWAALIALNISAWLQALALVDTNGRAHAKRLRRELINIPAVITTRGRQTQIRTSPRNRAGPFATAWANLCALPTAAT